MSGVSEQFDAIVIGAGQAGPPLAMRLAAAGRKVALIERGSVGGTCVNTGCTPTKALVASAYAAHLARRAADFGILVTGPVQADMARVKARKDAIVAQKRDGLASGIRDTEHLTLIEGHARFTGPKSIAVDRRALTADQIFLDVGGRAVVPPIQGLDRVGFLTNATIMDLDILPRHLMILGGSYIALEFAQMYRRFGSQVTVIEQGDRLIPREDGDVSQAVADILKAEGIAIHCRSAATHAARQGDDIALTVETGSTTETLRGSHLLLAVGRRPNTDDLGLEEAGLTTDAHGYIMVDDHLRAGPGIWAMGDCNGRGAFTHTAYNDYEIVAANLLDQDDRQTRDDDRRASDRVPCYALFIDPALGRCGMTLEQAKRSGRNILVGERKMTAVARAVEKGETQGFMRIVVDADSHEILGATILGPGGDEVVHGVLDLMVAKVPYPVLQHTMHIHPTVSELIPTILGALKPA